MVYIFLYRILCHRNVDIKIPFQTFWTSCDKNLFHWHFFNYHNVLDVKRFIKVFSIHLRIKNMMLFTVYTYTELKPILINHYCVEINRLCIIERVFLLGAHYYCTVLTLFLHSRSSCSSNSTSTGRTWLLLLLLL